MILKHHEDTYTEVEKQHEKLSKKQEELDDKLKELEIKINYKNKKNFLLFPTFTKNLVAIITAICLIDLQLTYVLAFFNKSYVAESLSQSICQTIIGVVLVYMVRAYFDSKAEYGNNNESLKDKVENFKDEKIEQINNAIKEKVDDIINQEPVEIPIENGEFEFNDDSFDA